MTQQEYREHELKASESSAGSIVALVDLQMRAWERKDGQEEKDGDQCRIQMKVEMLNKQIMNYRGLMAEMTTDSIRTRLEAKIEEVMVKVENLVDSN